MRRNRLGRLCPELVNGQQADPSGIEGCLSAALQPELAQNAADMRLGSLFGKLRSRAISLLANPRASKRRTSTSRAESDSIGFSGARTSRMSRAAALGVRCTCPAAAARIARASSS